MYANTGNSFALVRHFAKSNEEQQIRVLRILSAACSNCCLCESSCIHFFRSPMFN